MSAERVDLYQHIPPPVCPILVSVAPFNAKESVTNKYDISWAMRRLLLNSFRDL